LERGQHWAESKIKRLTGADSIPARFMRGDFFEFIPQFKLLIAGNHKPSLRSVDEAIRRRIHLIPFVITIPPAERDLYLEAKLKSEWPGILHWAVQGCLEWQRIGLKPPRAVREATENYLHDEDTLSQWIEECCVVGPSYRELSSNLYNSWKEWIENQGMRSGSQKRFTLDLQDKGFVLGRDERNYAKFTGLALREPEAIGSLETADLLNNPLP
jgi:putative DNA primase/helicase